MILSQGNLVSNLLDSAPLGGYREDDIALGALPLDHVFGLALLTGAVVLRHRLYLTAASAPEEPPYVAPGVQVKKGDTLCLIEAMKMMSEVPAPADCVVEEVMAKDGEAVGVGAPLFRIRRV